jgi:prevent-host-death family protein
MHMHEIPVTEARAEFSELINRVAYGGEPVIITRHGKPLVALVPAANVVENPAQRGQGPNQSAAPITVLDVTGRGGEPNGPSTVAAHHRDDPKTR